ncbi:MAG: hypothetical protein H6525_12410 [Actinobacteria bacterium]|nr:hypothetical protein [Actinomycetota bacterium]
MPTRDLRRFCSRTRVGPSLKLRNGLGHLQSGRCFWCNTTEQVEVADHVVPWSRSHNESVQNLVLTDARATTPSQTWLSLPALPDGGSSTSTRIAINWSGWPKRRTRHLTSHSLGPGLRRPWNSRWVRRPSPSMSPTANPPNAK